MGEKKKIETSGAPAAIGPYSQAIAVGELLFISGQLPIDMATGEFAEGGIGEMARASIRNADAIARAAGTDISRAVKATVFLTDMSDFAEVNAVYSEFFAGEAPARSCVAVAALPRGAKIEIEFIVAL